MNSKIKRENVSKNDFFSSKDLVKFINKNEFSNQPRYSQVVIEWIREWSVRSKTQILVESLLYDQKLFDQIELTGNDDDEQILWLTLLESENLNLISKWIDFSFAPNESNKEELFKTKLTHEMIDMIYSSRCFSTESKEIVLNYLAKFNVFCTQENTNFVMCVQRISSSGTMFDLEAFKSRDDNFHLKVILNFLNKKNNLIPFDFLWSYLNFYNSLSEENSAQSLLAHSQLIEINSSKSIRLMLAFRQNLKLTGLDPATFFSNICTKNFEFYLNQVDNLQISNLFTYKYKEHHLVALAMSLYFDVNNLEL